MENFLKYDKIIESYVPLRLYFKTAHEVTQHKSFILNDARMHEALGNTPISCILYNYAGWLEEHLITQTDDTDTPSKENRIISAASCYSKSGSTEKALGLFSQIPRSNLTSKLNRFIKKTSTKHALGKDILNAITQAHETTRDYSQIAKDINAYWGTIPPRFIVWILYKDALLRFSESSKINHFMTKALIFAVPHAAVSHLIYISSLALNDATDNLLKRHLDFIKTSFHPTYRIYSEIAYQLINTKHHIDTYRYYAHTALDLLHQTDPTEIDLITEAPLITRCYFLSSLTHKEDGNLVEAIATLESYINQFKPDKQILTWLGGYYILNHQPNESWKCLDAAIKLAPNDSLLAASLYGESLCKEGHPAKAIDIFSKALDDNNAEDDLIVYGILNNMGVAAFALENHTEALNLFNKSLMVYPYKIKNDSAAAHNINIMNNLGPSKEQPEFAMFTSTIFITQNLYLLQQIGVELTDNMGEAKIRA